MHSPPVFRFVALSVRHVALLALAALLLALGGCTRAGPAAADPLAGESILVAGGSGRTGRVVLQQLRAQQLGFRATTRDVAQAQARLGSEAADVAWIAADLRDPAQAARAVAGAHYVICVIGSREMSGPNSAQFVDYEAVRHLVDAAARGKVRHFVLLTAIGTTDKNSFANRMFKGALEWRFKGEEYLRASGVPYTIVRPAGLVDRPAGTAGVVLWQGDDWKAHLRKTIAREDLAAVLIESLRNPGARNATFEITNEATEPPGTWQAQLAALKQER
jgi:uncharacterized protein YbjT (DUF2867 family)